jgi:hypothetical protein
MYATIKHLTVFVVIVNRVCVYLNDAIGDDIMAK